MSVSKKRQRAPGLTGGSLFGNDLAFDPTLAALFSADPAPRKAVEANSQTVRNRQSSEITKRQLHGTENGLSASEAEDEQSSTSTLPSEDLSESSDVESEPKALVSSEWYASADREETGGNSDEANEGKRKRKRKADNEDLEANYLHRLAQIEERDQARILAERQAKRPRLKQQTGASDAPFNEEGTDNFGTDKTENAKSGTPWAENAPMHESLAPSTSEAELEKASRTCFLGNVSTEAIVSKTSKKTLLGHLSSFFAPIPVDTVPHQVESIRFRSTAFSSKAPKKGAFARKELMDATTKSTNAYVVYSNKIAAQGATKHLNGTIILGRHLRVDLVSAPAKTDHRRCVFVGNLGFVDDDSQMHAKEDEDGNLKPKNSKPGDVEEGLWRQFGQAGEVESVRVVRDPKTRVGKGIAYVQFADQNGVEAALLFDGKKFPPLLPRKMRVTRAKRHTGDAARQPSGVPKKGSTRGGNRPSDARFSTRTKQSKPTSGAIGREDGLRTDVAKLLGRSAKPRSNDPNGFQPPEAFVFEGHRASSKQGLPKGLRAGKPKKAGAKKPKNRSAKRAAAWKTKQAR